MKKSCCFVAKEVQSIGRVRKYQQQFCNKSNKNTLKATKIEEKRTIPNPCRMIYLTKNNERAKKKKKNLPTCSSGAGNTT
jgi:hypothetical protein